MADQTPPAADEPLDLAGILEAGPPKRSAVLDLERLDFSALGVGELLELSRAAGAEPSDLGRIMRAGTTADKGKLAVAIAWTIARRAEPELTLRDVERWAIEVRGKPTAANPKVGDPNAPSSGPTPAATGNRAARRASSSRKAAPSGSSASRGR